MNKEKIIELVKTLNKGLSDKEFITLFKTGILEK